MFLFLGDGISIQTYEFFALKHHHVAFIVIPFFPSPLFDSLRGLHGQSVSLLKVSRMASLSEDCQSNARDEEDPNIQGAFQCIPTQGTQVNDCRGQSEENSLSGAAEEAYKLLQ